jgi:hypothetical protein
MIFINGFGRFPQSNPSKWGMPSMTDAIAIADANTGDISHKLTVADVESNTSRRLQEIGRAIAEHFDAGRAQAEFLKEKAEAINRLILEAKELCDAGGFAKFRELFCPHLRKSQAYTLKAIIGGKKTFEEHRAEERDRKRRVRSLRKAGAENSGTVPETTTSDSTDTDGPIRHIEPESSCSRSRSNSHDYLLARFSAAVGYLGRLVRKNEAERFKKTILEAETLAQLGKLLTEVASLKSGATPTSDNERFDGIAERSCEDSA